jgi:hypothetical protein
MSIDFITPREWSLIERTEKLEATRKELLGALESSQHFITQRITYQGEIHSKLIKANEAAIARATGEKT